MDARLGTVIELVVVAALLAIALLYLRRRGMSTRSMLAILVAVLGWTLLVLILSLFGVPYYPWAVITVFVIALAVAAWSRWQRSRTP